MSAEDKKKLQSLGRSYLFNLEMERLARRAAGGDRKAADLLEELLPDCLDMDAWYQRSYWCSAVIRALVFSGTDRSLQGLRRFIIQLPPQTSYGCIELLAGLLPAYGRRALPVLNSLADKKQPGPARAIAVQALCNFFLEGMMQEEDVVRLRQLAAEFQSDPFLTRQVLDLIENRLQEEAPGLEIDRELKQLLEDVIIDGP